MELLVFFLLSSPLLAQELRRPPSNDDPFLPIFPDNLYNLKLVKRGSDRESPPLDSYSPKPEAKDSYGNTIQRNPHSRTRPQQKQPFNYPSPYTPLNLLSAYSNPYNYFYQPAYYPYFYPSYLSHPQSFLLPSIEKTLPKETKTVDQTPFIDGQNFIISDNPKDLDLRTKQFKNPNKVNHQAPSFPKPGPEYLFHGEGKAHLEQLIRQALVKFLAQLEAERSGKNGENYAPNNAAYGKVPQKGAYVPKPVTKVTVERSPGIYITPVKSNKPPATTQTPDYEDYDAAPSSHEMTSPAKDQDPIPYPVPHVVTSKPSAQAFSFRYPNHNADQEVQDQRKRFEDKAIESRPDKD